MSKIVTQRFEYVCYDDAGLTTGSNNVITAYPLPTEQYQNNAAASTGTSYGVVNITTGTAGAAVTFNVPAGATLTLLGNTANTVMATVYALAVPLVPGGTAVATMSFPVAPSQIVTLPGVLNPGTLYVQSQTSAMVASNTSTSLQIAWSL